MGVYAQLILCFFRATRCDGFDDGNYNRGDHNSSGGHGHDLSEHQDDLHATVGIASTVLSYKFG